MVTARPGTGPGFLLAVVPSLPAHGAKRGCSARDHTIYPNTDGQTVSIAPYIIIDIMTPYIGGWVSEL